MAFSSFLDPWIAGFCQISIFRFMLQKLCSSLSKIMYDDGLSIAFGAVDLAFYITLYIFLNLMNRESFYENLVVRGIIGIIIVDLISHWFVIFFESEFTCTEKYQQADLSLEGFFLKIYTVHRSLSLSDRGWPRCNFPANRWKILKDYEKRKQSLQLVGAFSKVMLTEGTIFISEWMLSLYFSFQVKNTEDADADFNEKRDGEIVPKSRRIIWHCLYGTFFLIRVVLLAINLNKIIHIEPVRAYAYANSILNLVNTTIAIVCLIGIAYHHKPSREHIITDRRTVWDEEDDLIQAGSYTRFYTAYTVKTTWIWKMGSYPIGFMK